MEYKEFWSAIFCQISYHYICHLSKGEGTIFKNKNVITFMRIKKGQKVDCVHIIFDSMCSELDRWYKYVRDNKGDKKDTY